jgi:hypothetical protein
MKTKTSNTEVNRFPKNLQRVPIAPFLERKVLYPQRNLKMLTGADKNLPKLLEGGRVLKGK